MRYIKSGIIIILSFCFCTYVSAQNNLTEARKQILHSNSLYGKAFENGDSSIFIDRYTRDAWIMPPNMPSLKGKTAAPLFFAIAYRQMGIRNVILNMEELVGDGSYQTETGNFQLIDKSGRTLDRGKYLVLWKNENGMWKMHRDCFNSDGPLSQQIQSSKD